MLNMGGPATLSEVRPFLTRLFLDRDIIQLPFQKYAAEFIVRRRHREVEERYAAIGGGSPILRWTNLQGTAMTDALDQLSPETAPHKHYPLFRYAEPLAETTLRQMAADGVRRAVAFSQYPQFSCTTTGSSLNDLSRTLRRLGLERHFDWSIIDRWPTFSPFIRAVAQRILEAIEKIPAVQQQQQEIVLVFSAHSLPNRTVNKGDSYPQEVGATVSAVMEHLRSMPQMVASQSMRKLSYMLCYQSQVGPQSWLGPRTDKVLQVLSERDRHRPVGQQHQHVIVVPIAFTSDHIETLSEIDVDFRKFHATFIRTESLNDMTLFTAECLAPLVHEHLRSSSASSSSSPSPSKLSTATVASSQYTMRCVGCTQPEICRPSLLPPAD